MPTALIDSVAPNEINVSDAVLIAEKMARSFCNSLPSGFHARISSQDDGTA